MSRDELHLRDKLMMLAESTKPFNVKRKAMTTKQASKTGSTSKLTMQDFVRMDPSYTPDIEHLVFPSRKRNNPQQVAPAILPSSSASSSASKTRSRLAEMFALSRHLQQRSADRDSSSKSSSRTTKSSINRSVDSVLDSGIGSSSAASTASRRVTASSSNTSTSIVDRRWAVEEPVHATRRSPSTESDMATTRGPNVSILHLRSTSEPWETSPTSVFTSVSTGSSRSYSSSRSTSTTTTGGISLPKQESLNFPISSYQKYNPQSVANAVSHQNTRADSYTGTGGDMYLSKSQSCNRELSPVRWCDREVDGVYLGRSGWVQVQHRSLDESRRMKYPLGDGISASRRTGLKLAEYQLTHPKIQMQPQVQKQKIEPQRPVYLPLKASNEFEARIQKARTPSPVHVQPVEAFTSISPPSLTPIISPPPAFQDRMRSKPVKRTFFGKAPFLPRSNAIIDSDPSPPPSPPMTWKSIKASSLPVAMQKRNKSPSPVFENNYDNVFESVKYPRIPQTKSLEDTSASRRSKFSQKFESSSSSSQSQSQNSQGQFRSLDSYVPRCGAMPRLSENTDSSNDVYEDADDEDNNSSSINMSITKPLSHPINNNNKISPSSRNSRLPYRATNRKSPVGSDTKPTSPGSSSSSSNERRHSRSPSNSTMRRTPPSRQYQDDPKVRRSRSLQLPDKKSNYLPQGQRISPQHPETYRVVKVAPNNSMDRSTKKYGSSSLKHDEELDEEMLREADIVTGFLYGSRSRAAAQALLLSRYDKDKKDLTGSQPSKSSTPMQNQKLTRGATTPTLASSQKKPDYWNYSSSSSRDTAKEVFRREEIHRERDITPTGQQQPPMMRSSQSYPLHQRSLDVEVITREPYKKRVPRGDVKRKSSPIESDIREIRDREPRRLSPNILSHNSVERRASPKFKSSSSSSSDYAIIVPQEQPQRVRIPRSAKSSGASTPLEDAHLLGAVNSGMHTNGTGTSAPGASNVVVRGEVILTRPGSAPGNQATPRGAFLDNSQRSMSLPKSFLSHRQGGQFPWRRRGTESLGSSPGFRRRTPIETSQTAPVTPLHDGNRRRSPSGDNSKRTKANSTPQLIDSKDDRRKYKSNSTNSQLTSQNHGKELRKQHSGNAESVLQKFRKTFSLRFQKKSSKDGSTDLGDSFLEVCDPSEEESPQHQANTLTLTTNAKDDIKEVVIEQTTEHKHSRFGPLIWRSSKERKKLNKAARSIKCNSGDSGIQIEMAPGCGGIGGDNSSESHGEADLQGDDLDSPPAVRRRGGPPRSTPRPNSDLPNQIFIDRFKAELLRSRTHHHKQHRHVRRTHSDLGGQRIYHWEARQLHRRMMNNTSPSSRPLSPRKKPPTDGPPPAMVLLRDHQLYRRGQLRRSLSQPLDIDKLSPIMKSKPEMRVANVVSEDETDMRGGTSDDETMSDSESSLASLSERKKSLDLPIDDNIAILAEAVFDHVAIEAEELAFRAGDVVEVLDTTRHDWWWGTTSMTGKYGWFPVNSVRLRVSQEDTVEDCLASMATNKSPSSQLRRRTSISLLSNDQVRTSVVRELVHTERDFVKVLQDVAEGYIAECRKREDMFSNERIDTIFINLEQILKFQSGFLKDLETCIDWDSPNKSCVGSCFIRHKDGFKMYSDYCNSHPMATATLQELYQYNNYSKFFEACRLMRGLIEIPLDGYLLTPVQRICKYPLQLAELLKYTKPEHADYDDIRQALDAMKGVAVLINERKRRMESLEKIEAWQQRVEAWEGNDLIEESTQLIHQGEVVRVTTGRWTSNIMLFLFDHQVVYCKKDLLRRNSYVYKGRICLDTSEIIDVPDGKDAHLGVNLRHAIKIDSLVRDKWWLVCCRSALDKQKWLQAFAEERKLVMKDDVDGMVFPESSRHLARIAARCQRRPPSKLRTKDTYKCDALVASNLHLNVTNTNSLGRKVGTWFTFGGNKKSRPRYLTLDKTTLL